MKIQKLSRRHFLGTAALAITGTALTSSSTFAVPAFIKNLGKPNSKFNGVQIGTITYSFRSMPSNAEQILKYCIDCNISAIELMGTTAEAFAGAPHSSTEPMTPFRGTPGQPRPQPTQEEQAERAARMKDIADWRAKVSMEKFEQIRKMYKAAGVSIYAYKHNALNCDLGHYTAAGYNPLELIEAKHDRIASAHLKDRQNKANGKANLVWGTGDTPIVEVLQLMKKNKYKFPATVELEYQIPEGSDAVKEVAKCVEYCRKALEKNA
jgi:sugar phosphate isomerase/epimerase